MSLFSRKPKRLTPKIFAHQIFALFSQVLQEEEEALRVFNRDSWQREEGWDYDLSSHTEAHKTIYAFLSIFATPTIFYGGEKVFYNALAYRIRSRKVKVEYNQFKPLLEMWHELGDVKHRREDDFTSKRVQAIAEKVCLFQFGERDEWHLNNVIMMSSSVFGYIASLNMMADAAVESLKGT